MRKMNGFICILNVLTLTCVHASTTAHPPQLEAGDTKKQFTSSAVLTLNWLIHEQRIQKDNGVVIKIPAATYQLTLPFTQYETNGQSINSNKQYQLDKVYNFNIHSDLRPWVLSDSAGNNLIKWAGLSRDMHVSFIPVQDNPNNTPSGQSRTNNLAPSGIIKIDKPITLIKNNKLFARIDAANIEKSSAVENDLMSISINGTFNEMAFVSLNKKYGPGAFSLVANKLDANVVAEMEQEFAHMNDVTAEEKIQTQLKILTLFPALYKNGAQLSGTFRMRTPSGQLDDQFTIDLSSLVANAMQFSNIVPLMFGLASTGASDQLALVFPILDVTKGHHKISMPKQDLSDFTQILQSDRISYRTTGNPITFATSNTPSHANDMVRSIVHDGLFGIQDEQYVTAVDFDRGQILTNNKSFVLEMLNN